LELVTEGYGNKRGNSGGVGSHRHHHRDGVAGPNK